MPLAPDTYRKAPGVQLVPSAESALALVRGEPGALWAVLAHTAVRALVMAPAGIAAGAVLKVRPLASVLITIGGAVAIEIGVIALAWRQVDAERAKARAAAKHYRAKPQAEEAPAPAVAVQPEEPAQPAQERTMPTFANPSGPIVGFAG